MSFSEPFNSFRSDLGSLDETKCELVGIYAAHTGLSATLGMALGYGIRSDPANMALAFTVAAVASGILNMFTHVGGRNSNESDTKISASIAIENLVCNICLTAFLVNKGWLNETGQYLAGGYLIWDTFYTVYKISSECGCETRPENIY